MTGQNAALNLLFQNLSPACTRCHFKSMTGRNVAPACDISEAYFQESRCWMPAALLSNDILPTTKSKTFWPHCYAEQLIGSKPRHFENVLVLANCLE